eukprot:7335612-Prymnesium_polylepis.1
MRSSLMMVDTPFFGQELRFGAGAYSNGTRRQRALASALIGARCGAGDRRLIPRAGRLQNVEDALHAHRR